MDDDSPERLTPAQFEALAVLAFGREHWQARTAAALGVRLRNVQYFAAGGRPIPPGVGAELAAIVRSLAADAGERARMRAWLAQHEAQGAAMRAALGSWAQSVCVRSGGGPKT